MSPHLNFRTGGGFRRKTRHSHYCCCHCCANRQTFGIECPFEVPHCYSPTENSPPTLNVPWEGPSPRRKKKASQNKSCKPLALSPSELVVEISRGRLWQTGSPSRGSVSTYCVSLNHYLRTARAIACSALCRSCPLCLLFCNANRNERSRGSALLHGQHMSLRKWRMLCTKVLATFSNRHARLLPTIHPQRNSKATVIKPKHVRHE